jgi:putative hydrolase of the HAD superfamily
VSGYDAVLLDLYDTLAWTEWPAMRAELEERFGLSERDLLRAFTVTRSARSVGAFGSAEGDLAAILEAAGVRAAPDLVRELDAERTRTLVESGVHLWDDSIPTLRELRRRGLRTAVVSNCDHATRPVVERLGLVDEADAVILSFEAGVAKPDAGIYLAALQALGGVEPGRSAFVDDQARYCDGARDLGIATFLIRRKEADPVEGTDEPGGHRVVRSLRALLDLV